MKQKIRYIIHVIGQETDYLAFIRGADEFQNADITVERATKMPVNSFKCTRDIQAYNTGLYSPLQWREFNCPYILTHISPAMTIEVRESEAKE